MFGNILDRGAGSFRFGPYGINVPTARTYVPGTNVLTTTWHTPGGWLLVHDALVMGPREGPDTVTPHTRPPADDDAVHLLVRTVECLEGSVEVDSSASRRSTTGGSGPPGRLPTPRVTRRTPLMPAARSSGSAPTC